MIRAGVGFSCERDPLRAAQEAVEEAKRELRGTRADWCAAFVTSEFGVDAPLLLGKLAEASETPYVVGCSGKGVVAGSREVEGGPAVGVLLVASDGMKATPFCFRDEGDWGFTAGVRIGQRFTGSRGREDLLLVWPDPYHVRPDHLLRGIHGSLSGVPVAGGAASSSLDDCPTFQFCGDECTDRAVSGVRLGGEFRYHVAFTQGCRPLSQPLRVTSSHENLIIEIEDRPALEVLREHAPERLLESGDRAFQYVFLGIVPEPDEPALERGDYLVRNVFHADPDTGILAIGDRVGEGQHVVFALREAATARNDVRKMARAAAASGMTARFAMYFDCLARGCSLYGEESVDASILTEALPGVPLLGFHSNAELAPIRGVNRLLTYTGVLVLVGE